MTKRGCVKNLAIGGSVVAFWLNYWLLNRMDASAMLMMGIAEVPIAIGLGAMVFGERLPPGTFMGAALILAAVLLTRPPGAPRPSTPRERSRSPAAFRAAGTPD